MSSNNFRKFGGNKRFTKNELFRNDTIHTNHLTVKETTDLYGVIDIIGDISLNGIIDISGVVTIHDDVTIYGNVDISGDISLNGIIDISGETTFYGPVLIKDCLGIGQNDISEIDCVNYKLDVSGNVYIKGSLPSGDTSANIFYVNNGDETQYFQIIDFSDIAMGVKIGDNREDEFSGSLGFINSDGGNPTSDNAELGYITFSGTDSSSNEKRAAYIIGHQDGDAGANFVPGKIQFYTTDNTGDPDLRVEIRQNGCVNTYTKNDLSFNTATDASNTIYNLILNKNTATDISGTVAMKFVTDMSGGTYPGAGAIVLEPSGNSYAMNFYVKTGDTAIDPATDKVFGIENEKKMKVFAPLDVSGTGIFRDAVTFSDGSSDGSDNTIGGEIYSAEPEILGNNKSRYLVINGYRGTGGVKIFTNNSGIAPAS